MSPLRVRLFLCLFVCTALSAAVIGFINLTGSGPSGISLPAALSSSPSYRGTLSKPAGAAPSISPAGPALPGAEGVTRIAAAEKSTPDLFKKNIEDTLALTLYEKVPEVRLSAKQIRELTEDILIMRETFAALRETQRTPEHAADISALIDRIDESDRRIRERTGMSAAEFLNRLTTEGIDNDKPEKAEVVLEYLDSPGR